MAQKSFELNLNTGYIPVTVNFSGGKEPTEILINPSDADLAKRLFEAQKTIEEKSKEIKDVEVDENGTPIIEDYVEKTNKINELVYESIDYAFNSDISSKIFKYCSPLAIIDGKPFVLQFLEKITPFIKETLEKEQKKSKQNTDKYLLKYMKK